MQGLYTFGVMVDNGLLGFLLVFADMPMYIKDIKIYKDILSDAKIKEINSMGDA